MLWTLLDGLSILLMADSIILTIARLNEAIVWTQDEDFEGMEGVKYLPKKNA